MKTFRLHAKQIWGEHMMEAEVKASSMSKALAKAKRASAAEWCELVAVEQLGPDGDPIGGIELQDDGRWAVWARAEG